MGLKEMFGGGKKQNDAPKSEAEQRKKEKDDFTVGVATGTWPAIGGDDKKRDKKD